MVSNNNFDENYTPSESDYSLSDNEYIGTDEDFTDEEPKKRKNVEDDNIETDNKKQKYEEPKKRKIEEESETDEEISPNGNVIFMMNFPGDLSLPSGNFEEVKPLADSTLNKKIKLERTKIEKLINSDINNKLSLSDKILLSNLPGPIKATVLQKIEDPNLASSDRGKAMCWGNAVLNLPLGTVREFPVNNQSSNTEISKFLTNAREILDKTVYGMNSTKEEIIDFLTKFITNPSSRGTVLGLHGDPGLAKTKLCMALSKILSLPYFQISFGGLTDTSILVGHDSTYVGSKPGLIAQNIKKAGCINPVICLDEIDKLGNETEKSSGVYGILTHLLDETQNNAFQDLYFDGIPIDLSKALFIATFNEISKIDPIVLNRIKVINIKSLMLSEKINIVKQYIIPDYTKEHNVKFSFSETLIEYTISRKTKTEPGMRNIKKNIETIFNRVNTIRLLSKCKDREIIHKDFSYKDIELEIDENGIIKITKKLIDNILKGEEINEAWMNMYI
jgi:ATP-dependent Lon protease